MPGNRVNRNSVHLCSVVGSLRFDLGRPCEGAPAARSLTTEYTCGLVWRARNPKAPRQTFAGEILRMRGVGASGSVCFSVVEEQTAGCVVSLATIWPMSSSSAPKSRNLLL